MIAKGTHRTIKNQSHRRGDIMMVAADKWLESMNGGGVSWISDYLLTQISRSQVAQADNERRW